LFIALGLHRNSINDMHIIYDFLLHLLVQFTYIYREQPLVHSPSHQRTIVAARLVLFYLWNDLKKSSNIIKHNEIILFEFLISTQSDQK
jgi:hypothetical protein